jgi:hypothetical protein
MLVSGHADTDNIFYVLEASYTDKGGAGGSNPLTGRAQVILQPKHKQAEYFSNTGRTPGGKGNDVPGVTVENGADSAGGGQDVGFIQDGDWWSVEPAAPANISAIRLRVASASAGGVAEVHWNSPTGTLLGSAVIPGTGGWQTYTDVIINLTNSPATSGKLYFVAHNPAGTPGYLFNVNWMDFIGPGVGVPGPKVISLSLFLNLFGGFRAGCLVEVLGLADWWVGGDLLVTGAGWAAWAWSGGFRRAGRNRQFRAQVAKPTPDPGRAQPAGFGGRAFPRAA